MFKTNVSEKAILVSQNSEELQKSFTKGVVKEFIITQKGTRVVVENKGDGFLVVSDSYYPLIRAYIDGKETKIYEIDYAIRGIAVPKGSHIIEFKTAVFHL
jgi:uncharacterized membrane protein YfhO